MTEIRENPQIMYFHTNNAMGVGANLLTFGYTMFAEMSRWQAREDLKNICNGLTSNQPNVHELGTLIFNQLSDCIKLTICFENYMKTALIYNGYIIHKLDKNLFPELYKEQFKRPITWQEVKDSGSFEINNSINIETPELRRQVKGLLSQTIGMKDLLSSGYQRLIMVDEEIIRICNPYFQYRNNLHLYMGIDFSISSSDYSDLTKIADFINTKVVGAQNEFADKLGMAPSKKLPELLYAS